MPVRLLVNRRIIIPFDIISFSTPFNCRMVRLPTYKNFVLNFHMNACSPRSLISQGKPKNRQMNKIRNPEMEFKLIS